MIVICHIPFALTLIRKTTRSRLLNRAFSPILAQDGVELSLNYSIIGLYKVFTRVFSLSLMQSHIARYLLFIFTTVVTTMKVSHRL